MDLDGKWQWVRRKLPRRLIPPGDLFGNADGRGMISGQLNISQGESPSPQLLSQEEVERNVTTAAALASRRGDSFGQQQSVRRKGSPKSPPRRVILNQKLERVQAALKSPSAMAYGEGRKTSSGGSRDISGARADEEEEKEDMEDRRRILLAALMDVDGTKKQRQGASAKIRYSSPSMLLTRKNVGRAGTISVITGSSQGSGEGAAKSRDSGKRDSTHFQRHGSVHGTVIIDSTSSSSGNMASTGCGGARGMKGATYPASGAVEQESGGIQLKPPIPIDHRRKSRLPDYFGEGDEKRLGFNIRNLHLFPPLRTPLEGEKDEGGRESGAPTSTAAPIDLQM